MKKILIIDDKSEIRKMFRQFLEMEGYKVKEAEDGEEEVSLFKTEHFDLVITDIFMPEKDCYEVVQELRKDFPEVKIIALSGGSKLINYVLTGEYLKMAGKLGADITLQKGIRGKDLVNAVKGFIKTLPMIGFQKIIHSLHLEGISGILVICSYKDNSRHKFNTYGFNDRKPVHSRHLDIQEHNVRVFFLD